LAQIATKNSPKFLTSSPLIFWIFSVVLISLYTTEFFRNLPENRKEQPRDTDRERETEREKRGREKKKKKTRKKEKRKRPPKSTKSAGKEKENGIKWEKP
jgi:flagellar biosynthesis/type III secretory pathway M-ring protein FliF/YscJ